MSSLKQALERLRDLCAPLQESLAALPVRAASPITHACVCACSSGRAKAFPVPAGRLSCTLRVITSMKCASYTADKNTMGDSAELELSDVSGRLRPSAALRRCCCIPVEPAAERPCARATKRVMTHGTLL